MRPALSPVHCFFNDSTAAFDIRTIALGRNVYFVRYPIANRAER